MFFQPGKEGDLLEALEETFPPYSPPSGIVCGSGGGGIIDERDQVENDYLGLRWTEVPPETIGFNVDALAFMTDEGRAYYLPAFIRKYLLDRKGADIIPQGLIAMLTPGLGYDDQFQALTTRMTPRQKRFIRAFLEYVRDGDPYYARQAEAALVAYWGHVPASVGIV